MAEDSELIEEVTTSSPESAASDALVKSVVKDGESLPNRPKTKSKARAGRRNSDETIDNLVDTVNQLAGSVTTLAGTVESLGEKVHATVIVEPAPLPEPAPVVEAAIEEEAPNAGSPLLKVAVGYASALFAAFGVGLVAWGAMQTHVQSLAIAAIIGGALAVVGVLALRDHDDHDRDLRALAIGAVASAFLALGFGILVGGVQFFSHAPARAAILIPIGLALSAVGFVMRSPHRVSREHVIWMVGAGVWVCLGLFIGVNALVPDSVKSETKSEAAAGPNAESSLPAAQRAEGSAAANNESAPAPTEVQVTTTIASDAAFTDSANGIDHAAIQEAVDAATAASGQH